MKLLIGLTMKDGISREMHDTLFRYRENPVTDGDLVEIGGEGFVGRARNNYCQILLENKQYSRLLSVDSDIPFHRSHVERLMSHDVDVVGGIYYRKQWQRVPVMEALMPDGTVNKIQENGLLRVRYIGTGFLLVKREVFEAMAETDETPKGPLGLDLQKYAPWYIHEETDIKQWDFFPCAVDMIQRRYLSEDWWFCHRANNLGFTVWADTKCVVPHLGTAIFPLRKTEYDIH
jgi:hypothetical protein